MNNYYGWNMPHIALTNIRQQEPRRFDLGFDTAYQEDLGHGFTRYSWTPQISIRRGEFVDFRLITRQNEHVISAGFNTSRPLQNVSIVQLVPRHPHVMVIILHNEGTSNAEVTLWVVAKRTA